MTVWQLKELQDQADALACLLRQLESIVCYEEFSNAKRLLRQIIEPEACPILRRLLHERGIEL